MKTILCYGDSNTYGSNPTDGPRFDRHTRWPGVLQDILGKNYVVIEEGCSGRTTVFDDPFDSHKNGAQTLPAILKSHQPLDLVVIFLGTNDLKAVFHAAPNNIARGVEALVGICRSMTVSSGGTASPDILVVAPPALAQLSGTPYVEMFAGGEEKSRQLGSVYRKMADRIGCHLLDAGAFVKTSPVDGVHLDAEAHAALGSAVAEKVRYIFSLQQQPVA